MRLQTQKALLQHLKEGNLFGFLSVNNKKVTRKDLEIIASELAYILFDYMPMSAETKQMVTQATIDAFSSAGLFN